MIIFDGVDIHPITLAMLLGGVLMVLIPTLMYGDNRKKGTKPANKGTKAGKASRGGPPKERQWRKAGLSLSDMFDRASSSVPMFADQIDKERGLEIYGLFKQGTVGDVNIPEPGRMDPKGRAKWGAWNSRKGMSQDDAMKAYVAVVDALADNAADDGEEVQVDNSVLYPMRISGVGRYLPVRVVTNAEVEKLCGVEEGWTAKRKVGITERRWAEGAETNSFMAAAAAREAVKDAGLKLSDIECIIHGCGCPERAIPDTSVLVQRQLGLGESGIPCFSVHATCLSFMVALDTAGALICSGKHKTILVVSSEIASCGANFSDPESAILLGDGAGAVVVQRTGPEETAGVHKSAFGTFSVGADLTTVYGGGTYRHPNNPKTKPSDNVFQMDGGGIMKLVMSKGRKFLDSVLPGLSKGLGDIDIVVPHQPSELALQSLEHYGWPRDKILRTIHMYGNCVAASIPLTLYMAIKEKKAIHRGDKVMIAGTGAGLTFGTMILTY